MAKITYNDKTNFRTDPSVAEVNKVTDANMNEIKNVVNDNAQRHIISAGSGTDKTVTAQSGIVVLSTSVKTGNKLSLSNGKVVIGADVSKVLVSANMRISTTGGSSLGVNLNILKNDTAYISSNRTSLAANGYDGLATSTRLVEVQEGDTISMYYWKSSTTQSLSITSDDTYGGSYLTVEVIE